MEDGHCVKTVRIRSYSGLHFPAFGLNTERYGVSHRIQSEWIWKNADLNNSEYRHFSRSGCNRMESKNVQLYIEGSGKSYDVKKSDSKAGWDCM